MKKETFPELRGTWLWIWKALWVPSTANKKRLLSRHCLVNIFQKENIQPSRVNNLSPVKEQNQIHCQPNPSNAECQERRLPVSARTFFPPQVDSLPSHRSVGSYGICMLQTRRSHQQRLSSLPEAPSGGKVVDFTCSGKLTSDWATEYHPCHTHERNTKWKITASFF